jgi:RimJ/RimL family protein N-acetyltransferase
MTGSVQIPVLTTARLKLRGPKDSDAVALGAFLTSPRAQWIGGPYPAEDAPDWLSHQQDIWNKRGWGSWIAALKDSDTPIGRVGLLDHDGWPEPELAWFLFEGFEGHGYAAEAAIAARAYAAGTLGLSPLFSFVEPANKRSRALAERLGAAHERDASFKGHSFRIYRHPGHEASA